MQALDPSGFYGADDVLAALKGVTGTRRLSFRYDLCDNVNNVIRPLSYVLSGSVAYSALADIKRTAKFTLLEGDTIDYGSQRIKPWIRLAMPDGGYVEWPQGVFLLSTPTRTLAVDGTVTRDVDAYDPLVALQGYLLPTRFSIPAGTKYTDAVGGLLTGMPYTVIPASPVVTTGKDWDPGTSVLSIVNDLLGAISYRSAWADENGVIICEPYQAPSDATIEFTYATDNQSIITGEVDESLDLFTIPNQWTRIVSDPDRDPLVSIYTNTNPASPTSTVARGRIISDFVSGVDAADQATLDALVARAAYEASQVYSTREFETAIMPIHSDSDVLGVIVNALADGGTVKFSETAWSMDLRAGATMKHSVRRAVSV